MSLATLASSPTCSRWVLWRACSGLSTGARRSSRNGTPSSTTSPSCTDVESRITATTTSEMTAPANRPSTSIADPKCSRSLAPMLTTSPVATRRCSVPPSSTALRVRICCTRYAAVSQFETAARCRRIPAIAPASPSPSKANDQSTSAPVSFAVDAVVDRLAEQRRRQRLGEHPDRAHHHRVRDRRDLLAGQPQEEPHGRRDRRPSRIGHGVVAHFPHGMRRHPHDRLSFRPVQPTCGLLWVGFEGRALRALAPQPTSDGPRWLRRCAPSHLNPRLAVPAG